ARQSHAHGQHAHGDHGDLHAPGHRRDFSDVERWSAIFDAPDRDAWQRPGHVIELMAIERGMTVADLGAGTGYFLPHLAAAVGADGRVYGLDVEESLVNHMRERAEAAELRQVKAQLAPRDGLGLAPSSLDRLLIVNVWHHLDDRPNYAKHIGEMLKEGGKVVVVDYTRESEQGPPPKHRLSAERVIAELEAGGLQAEVVEEELPRQYVVVASLP
ncbi:MAG: methyltransferase domain-containing protein, partial [Acidobacteriota bacterium]